MDLILYVSQEANFQSRTMLIPMDEFIIEKRTMIY